MQNIDYARRLKHPGQPIHKPAESERPIQMYKHQKGAIHSWNPSKSILFVLVGSISIFTAGVVTGLRIDQKEKKFAQEEFQSFRNVSGSPDNVPDQTRVADRAEKESQSSGQTDTNRSNSNDSALQFPPKSGRMNFLVEIPTKSAEEAKLAGKRLLRLDESLQGRIFRSSTGKLYLGYYYSREDAEAIRQQIQSSGAEEFRGAKISAISAR